VLANFKTSLHFIKSLMIGGLRLI